MVFYKMVFYKMVFYKMVFHFQNFYMLNQKLESSYKIVICIKNLFIFNINCPEKMEIAFLLLLYNKL